MKKPEQSFNLNYNFGSDLRENPEDSSSMLAYIEYLMKEAKDIAPTIDNKGTNARAMVKFLGEAGVYYRILGKTDAAEKALKGALDLIEVHSLGQLSWGVQTIRLGDVYRYKNDALSAETAYRSVLELCRRSNDLTHLTDFCHQHLGKLYFEQKKFKQALAEFKSALKIRELKKDNSLLESTKKAIAVTEFKIRNPSR